MPFTFSHPAIILPLGRFTKYFSLTALIAGSMVPDFEYFIHMRMIQIHGHSIEGMFYYDLPLGLLLCFIFHLIVRDTLIEHSPFKLKNRFLKFHGFDWISHFKEKWLVVIFSVLLGTASHLFWDGFTHADRYFVELLPFLKTPILLNHYELPLHDFIWLLSSIIGLFIVMAYFLKLSSFQLLSSERGKSIIYWVLVFTIMLIVLILRDVNSMNVFIATSISGTLIGMIVTPLLLNTERFERKILNKE